MVEVVNIAYSLIGVALIAYAFNRWSQTGFDDRAGFCAVVGVLLVTSGQVLARDAP